jgi:hypothetical protein
MYEFIRAWGRLVTRVYGCHTPVLNVCCMEVCFRVDTFLTALYSNTSFLTGRKFFPVIYHRVRKGALQQMTGFLVFLKFLQ